MSITEGLRSPLPYQSGPEKNAAVGPREPRLELVLEGLQNPDSEDEFFIPPELLEALRWPTLC